MGVWLEFLQVALALGAGWLGYVLLFAARSAQAAPAHDQGRGRRAAAPGRPVANPHSVDSEP